MSFGFENTWMLFWGLAAAIPLVLYLLRRRQVDTVAWAAMQFLQQSRKTRFHRLNLRQLFLLLIQMSIPLLIAICAAAPFFRSEASIQASQRKSHWILVFDTSLSMSFAKQQQSCIDIARELAWEIIEQAGETDGISVITSGRDFPSIQIQDSNRIDITRRVIGAIQEEYGELEIAATMQAIDDVRNQVSEQDYDQTNVVFFSDLAQHTWNASDSQSLLEQLTQVANVSMIPCGDESRPNIAITKLESSVERGTVDQPITLNVEISGFELAAPQSARLELWVNESIVEQKTVVVPSDSQTAVTFQYRPDRAGDCLFHVAIEPDNLWIDNHRYLVVSVSDRVRLLCLEGFSGAGASIRSATPAINVPGVIRIESTFRSIDQYDFRGSSQYDCICMAGIESLSDQAQLHLRRYLETGGSLLVFCGPSIDVAALNQFLSLLSSNDDRPAAQFDLTPVSGDFLFDTIGYQHPAVKIFKDFPRSGLIDVPTWKYLRAQVDDDKIERVINFDTGDPAVFSFLVGRGRIVIWTAAITGTSQASDQGQRWSALDAWWSFVPLLTETASWMYHKTSPSGNYLIGDSIICEFIDSSIRRRFVVVQPGGAEFAIEGALTSDGNVQLEIGIAKTPGSIRVRPQGANESDDKILSVNTNAGESDLRRPSGPWLMSHVDQPFDSDNSPISQTSSIARDLLGMFFAGLLIVLVAEIAVANMFSRQSAARAK